MKFGEAIEALKEGKAIQREGWNGKGLFIVKQNPCTIKEDILPKLQNLPQIAKDILMSRENPHIDYTNQMLIINPDGRADSWVASSSDTFAEDWIILNNNIPDYLYRLHKEYTELCDKIDKLDKALKSEGFEDKVGTKQFNLMKRQSVIMGDYRFILKARIEFAEK